MAELVDAHGSGPCPTYLGVWVQIPPSAPSARGGIGIRDSLRSYARKSVGVRVPPSAQGTDSSAGLERLSYTEEVRGSNPLPSTGPR